MNAPLMIRINDGPELPAVSIESVRDLPTMYSQGPRPNRSWETVDSRGHFHAYSTVENDPYPTLTTRTVPVPCDGSCGGVCGGEGTSETTYHCRICDEQIKPGLVHGAYSFTVPGLTEWRIKIQGALSFREDVTVRLPHGRFGVATVVDVSWQAGVAETELVVSGPLGRRQATEAVTT